MTTTSKQKPILIAGAGLASLLLAQRLHQASIPVLIFEREASMTVRSQGYRLRLSGEGLDAIEASLGPEKFQKFWDTCGKTGGGGLVELDALTFEERPSRIVAAHTQAVDAEGKAKVSAEAVKVVEQMRKNSGPGNSMLSRGGKVVGIARGEMRQLFMEGCEEFVKWSHHVTGYELIDSGGVRAIFADGSKSVEGEMLVGGEGVLSGVAKQLSEGKIKVYDLGARGIQGQASTTAFKGLGEGVWRLVDESQPHGMVSIITNVRPESMDDPNVLYGWTMQATPGVIKAPNDNFTIIGKAAADIAKSLTANWHPLTKPMFDEMNEHEAAFWKLTCSTPTGVPEWKNEPRVTVIGDAAHAMTPAMGTGANTAVQDSALLGELLIESGGLADGVTAAYEREMRVYASRAVRESYAIATIAYQVEINENSTVL